ncbi:MAG: hypothetical protein ACOVMT_00905 [Caulobacter sp.]
MFALLQLLFLINWLLVAAACIGAWRWGERPERGGALLTVAIFAGFALASLMPDKEAVRGIYLVLDGLFALGLLLLALRHATRWLGIAVLLQGVQFSLHAYYLVADKNYDNFYILVNNLVTFGVLTSLLAGIFRGRLARRAEK